MDNNILMSDDWINRDLPTTESLKIIIRTQETEIKKLRDSLVNTNKIIKDSSEVGYPVNVVLRGQYEVNQKVLKEGK